MISVPCLSVPNLIDWYLSLIVRNPSFRWWFSLWSFVVPLQCSFLCLLDVPVLDCVVSISLLIHFLSLIVGCPCLCLFGLSVIARCPFLFDLFVFLTLIVRDQSVPCHFLSFSMYLSLCSLSGSVPLCFLDRCHPLRLLGVSLLDRSVSHSLTIWHSSL